jgi:hypothetical protein
MSAKDQSGFVDLLVDTPVNGRLYMCATCLFQAGRVMGMLNPEQSTKLTERLAAASDRVLELERELEQERGSKLVSLDDARRLILSGSKTSDPEAA